MTGESKKTTMTIPHQNPASTSANNPTKPLKRILKHHKSSYRPNSDQYRLLLGWLRKRLKGPLEPRLEIIYNVFVRYAQKAIELDAGIVFDL